MEMEELHNTVEDIFEMTKNAIREILNDDFAEKVKRFAYNVNGTEHTFKMEEKDVSEMLPIIQRINLGLIDEVEVIDVDGNVLTLQKDEYLLRNLAGFRNKEKEKIDLDFLDDVLEEVETFAEFVHFENLETAKNYFIPKVEEPEEMEEEVIFEEIENEEI